MRLDATMTRRRRGWLRRASLLVAPLIATGPLLSRAPTASADTSSGFNQPGNVLIADQFNNRVIEIDRDRNIVWQNGQRGVIGWGPDQLNNANSAELLPNGHILISDENNNRAIEVTRKHQIVTTFTAGGTTSGVAFSSRLPNGHTLITDSNNSRIVEVDATDHVVWFYFPNTDPLSTPAPLPTRPTRLRNGAPLIRDPYNDQVIRVNEEGEIVA